MNTTALALLGFALWILILLTMIAAMRVTLVFQGKRAPNNFKPFGDDVSSFSGRLCRAHLNCCENLPIAGAIMLTALATGNTAITDPLAFWLLGARLAQSLTHIISTSNMAVNLRFGFMATQTVIEVYWVVQLGMKLIS